MAEENIPFSPLDPLGPEYGRSDLPTLDVQGLSSFEGDEIEQPKINFPKDEPPRYYPILPNTGGTVPQKQVIKKTIGQPPGPAGPAKGSTARDILMSLSARSKADMSSNQSKGTYGGTYNYNAGASGNAYYNRYHAYGQEKFDRIGFSPLQDNEAVFNGQTSKWNDFSRMMTHSFMPLFWNAFASGPKSMVKMMQGDFTSVDAEGAKLYEEAAGIGQSTKGGLFGFFNNTAMSSAYTAGIISEVILEELAAAAFTGVTGGAGGGALVATTAKNAARIPGIFRTIRGFDKAVDGTKAVQASLKTLNNIDNTRSYWNKFKSAVNTPLGKFINPAENTLDAIESIVRNEDNLTGLARTMYGVNKTAGGLYRDVRGVNMALSEARLEGGFVQNEVYDKLYSDFYQDNQRRPTNEEQRLLYKQAKEAGVEALGWNAAIIHASNKIMFPNILGPRGGINSFIKAKTRDILDLKAGKIIFENAGKKVAKDAVKTGAQKGMKGSFRYVENSLMNSVKGLAKDPIRAIPKVLGYAKANFSEGIQENLQEVISETTKNYYVDSFKDPSLANYNYARSLFNTSLRGQFSSKGFETFASGFVMGMFGAPLNHVVPLLSYGKARLFNNEKYQEYVNAKQKVGTQMVNHLNELGADPSEFFNSKITNLAVQNKAGHVIKNGNTKEVNDAKSESFINQLTTAFETNTLDFFKDHLNSFKQYTPEEFEEALGLEKGTGAEYQARIDDILTHADNMQTTYKNLNQKYPDQINLDDYKKGSDDYNRAAIYKSALAEGKRNAVFFKHTYDDTMSRMYDISSTLLTEKPLKNMSAGDMQAIFEPSRMKSEMEMMRYEIETLRQSGKADDSAKADKIEGKIAAMENFLKALNYRSKHYAADPSKIKSDFIDTLTDEQKEQITEEELDELLDRELEAQNMVRRSDESDLKVNNLFEKAYKDYLKAVANTTDDTYFDEAADKAFEKILDYYNLEKESRDMAKYVNLLNNPGDFADLVERHFEWKKQLWENRKDYYRDQVQASMNAFADNALLNQLADENFYVSLDDFERWQETGQVPDEFFNDQKNIVVREGMAEYDRFSAIFDAAFLARQAGVLDENLNYDEELKKELEELDAQKAQELDALPKVEVTTELDPVEPSKGSKVTAKDIEDQVQNTEYIDITFKTKDGQDEISLYRSEDGTFNNVNTGALVDLKSMKLDIIDNKRYTQDLKPDPEQAQEIENVYKNKKADVINKYAEKKAAQAEAEEEAPVAKAEAKKAEPAVYSATDDFSTLDKALQDQLQEAFIKNFPEAEEFDDEQFFNELRAFTRTSGVARRIIDEYNKKSKLTAATEVTGVPEKLVIKLSGKEVDLTDQPESVIKKNRQLLMMQINNMQNKSNRTPDENLMLAEAKADKAKIDRYLKSRDTKEISEKMQETINRLQLVFDAQAKLEKINEAYYVDNQLMRRVTKAIEELGVTEYSYSDQTKVLASVNQTLVKNKSIEDFIADLRTKRPSGFSEYTYNELQKELTSIMKEKKLTPEEIRDEVMAIVKEKTYEASRIAGNYIDNQIKNIFDPKIGKPVFDENSITRIAYNNLFGPEGIVTDLKAKFDRNEIAVYTKDIRVFDKDAGIAGEIDIIIVDRDGNVKIVDVKTGESNKWNNFQDKKKFGYQKQQDYILQQTAYANLLFNMTGLNASIGIFPIEITKDDETGKVLSAQSPKVASGLLPGAYEIPLDKSLYQKEIDSIIPRKGVAVESKESAEAANLESIPRQDADDVPSPAVKAQETLEEKPIGVGKGDADMTQQFAMRIRMAKSKQALDAVKTSLNKAVKKLNAAEVVELSNQLEERYEALSEGVLKLNKENLKESDKLIVKTPIFIRGAKWAIYGNTLVITDVSDTGVTVRKARGKKTETLTFAQVNALTTLKDSLADMKATTEKPLTKKEQDIVAKSKANIDEFVKDFNRLDAIEAEADSMSIEDLEERLFNQNICE
jgi:hypothetical protein